MKLKHLCFMVIPVIFFGCGAYQFISQSQERMDARKFPKNKAEMQKEIEKRAENFNGRKR